MGERKIIEIENAKIIFRNFRGEERKPYNAKGDRNFNLVLDKDQADILSDEGFNIRVRPSRDEDGEPQYLLSVAVSYKIRPPKIYIVTGKGKRALSEDTVGELDYAEIRTADLSIRPHAWSMPNGNSGVKAYLNKLYVVLEEDAFEEKYADMREDGD